MLDAGLHALETIAMLTSVVDPLELMLENRLPTKEAGLVTVFLKFRIFLSGGCFSENTKNNPKAITTNSANTGKKMIFLLCS